MRIRRLLAFVLSLAMILGNVTPAYAADNDVIGNISENVTITADENGNIVFSDNEEEDEEEISKTAEEGNQGDSGQGSGSDNASKDTGNSSAGDTGSEEGENNSNGDAESQEGENNSNGDAGSEEGESKPDGDEGSEEGESKPDGDEGSEEGESNPGGDEGNKDTGSQEGEKNPAGEEGSDDGEKDSASEDNTGDDELQEGENPEDGENLDNEENLDGGENLENEELQDELEEEEEESLSGNEISVSVNELPMKTETSEPITVYIHNERNQPDGEVSFSTFFGEDGLQTYIQQVTKSGYSYEVYIEDDMELNNETLNLASDAEAEVNLFFPFKNKLTIKGKSYVYANQIQKADIILEEGAELYLIPTKTKPLAVGAPATRLSVGTNSFNFSQSSTLILGDDTFSATSAYVELRNDNTFSGLENAGLTLKGTVSFMETEKAQYWENKNKSTDSAETEYDNKTLRVGTLTVKNRKEEKPQNGVNILIEDKATVGIPLDVTNLTISGTLEGTAVTADNITATAGSKLTICRESTFGNITVNNKGDNELYLEEALNIVSQDVYNTEKSPRLLTQGSLKFVGNLTSNVIADEKKPPVITIEKKRINYKNQWERPGQETGSVQDQQILAVIQTTNQISSSLDEQNYQLSFMHGNNYDVEIAKEEGDTSYLKAVYISSPIVSVAYSGAREKKFDSFARAKEYILSKEKTLENSQTIFQMTLLEDVIVNQNDLNFDSLTKGTVSLDFNGKTLTVNGSLELGEKNLTVKEGCAGTIKVTNGALKFASLEKNQEPDTGYVERDLSNVSLEAGYVEIVSGDWSFKEITTNFLYIENDQLKGNKGTLNATKIVITKGGSMTVKGTLGNRIRPDLTLDSAQLFVQNSGTPKQYGKCYLNSLTVAKSKAFAGESMKDFTVMNFGDMFVQTLSMEAGTLQNLGNILADKVVAIKDFHNYGSFICNTFTQQSGSKTYLGNCNLLINDSGTLNNVNLGYDNGGYGESVIGLGSQNEKLIINGALTQNDENAKLIFVVTDAYANINNSFIDDYINKNTEFDLEGNSTIIDKERVLFTTDQKTFPTESIEVWQGENKTFAVQKEYKVWVAQKTINLYYNVKTSKEPITSFVTWNEAMTYLNTFGNVNTEYQLELADEVTIEGTLQLPKNVKSLDIAGTGNGQAFKYTGTLTPVTDTKFSNVTLNGPKVDLKTKPLILENVSGSIASVTGNTGELVIRNSNLDISGSVSSIPTMTIKNDQDDTLQVTISGDVSLKDRLRIDNANVNINGKLTTPQLDLLKGTEASSVTATDIVITDINIQGERNSICYSGSLEIKGQLTSTDYEDVYAVPNDNEYEIKGGLSNQDKTKAYKQVKKNAINLMYTELKYFGTENHQGKALATTPNISAEWFLVNCRPVEILIDGEETTKIIIQASDVTYKEGSTIYYGSKNEAEYPVILYSVDNTTNLQLINTYKTLQDAFNEIDRRGNANVSYTIHLKADDAATDKSGNYKFPTKAAGVSILGDGAKRSLSFKNTADIKCSMEFINTELTASAAATCKLNANSVTLKNSSLSKNIAITGSGVAKGSSLSITVEDTNSYVRIASIKDVNTLTITDTTLYVDGATTIGNLSLSKEADLCSVGAIKTGNVECLGVGTITTFPKVTMNTEEEVTATTSALEITGEVVLKDDNDVVADLKLQLGKTLDYSGTTPNLITFVENDFREEAIAGDKIILAKAPKVATRDIHFVSHQGDMVGYIYKKAGNLIYKVDEATVELSYENAEGREIVTEFANFADAVAEINSLKTKRDYTVTFLVTDDLNPTALTMPTAANVNTLTLTSFSNGGINPVYYLKDLTFPSNVVLKDIYFEQMVQEKDEKGKVITGSYIPADDEYFPAAVTVKASGASLTIEGRVCFNTPVILNGGKNTSLIIYKDETKAAVIIAKPHTYPSDIDQGEASQIQGKITGFGEAIINTVLDVNYWQTGEDKYTAAEFSVTTLTLKEDEGDAQLIVGEELPYDEEISLNNLVKVDNLTMTGGSLTTYGNTEIKKALSMTDGSLTVYGNAEIKDLTLLGDGPSIAVTGQKFNITGQLTPMATNAVLETTVDSKYISVLNISGKTLAQVPQENRITVKVVDENETAVTLTKLDEEEQTYSTSYLLKAKNIHPTVFLVHEACVEDNEEYNVNEPANSGYFLKKVGDYVEVHHSDAVEAILCKTNEIPQDDSKDIPVMNYYKTLNDAIAEIKALNNASEEYTIFLLRGVGTSNDPYPMTVPEKAAKVTFATSSGGSDGRAVLYIDTALNQKTNLVFEDIIVTNYGTWDTKKLQLEIRGADLAIHGKATLDNLVLTDANAHLRDKTNITNLTLQDLDSESYTVLDLASQTTITNITKMKDLGNEKSYIRTEANSLTIKEFVTYKDTDGSIILEYQIGAACEPLTIEIKGSGHDNVENTDSNTEDDITQYDLKKATKLLTLEKEVTGNLSITTVDGGKAVWASKGIYWVEDDYSYGAFVTNNVTSARNYCLDMAEAINFINTVADKNGTYNIDVGRILPGTIAEVNDTKVTDSSAISEFPLPAKDKAASVSFVSQNGASGSKISFTNDLKVYGNVTFTYLELDNDKEFSISMDKNSNGDSSLTLNDVTTGQKSGEKSGEKVSKLKNITGKKGSSNVTIKFFENDQDPKDINYMDLTGAVTDVANLTLSGGLKTQGKSTVDQLTIGYKTESIACFWEASGVTTIGNVVFNKEKKVEAYLGTSYANGIPQLTITGKVTGRNLAVKILDFHKEDGNLKDEYNDPNNNPYKDAKLVIAKAESAGKFIAKGYATWNKQKKQYEIESNIISYKDKNGYVYNGNINDKDVKLTQYVQAEDSWVDSYVNTYAEAIEIINGGGSKDDVYVITLLNEEVTLTSQDSNGAALGTLALPKDGKASDLTIKGETINDEGDSPYILQFTGAIQPNCNLYFENVILNEVTKEDEDVQGLTVKPGTHFMEFRSKVKVESERSEELVFKTIDANKGTVILNGGSVYVSGETKVKDFMIFGDTQIYGKGKITISDIIFGQAGKLDLVGEKEIALTDISHWRHSVDERELTITTYYKNKALTSSETQLTINGEVDSNIAVKVQLYIYVTNQQKELIDKKLEEQDLQELTIGAYAAPKAYQKVIKAPKMKSDQVTLMRWVESETINDHLVTKQWVPTALHAVKQDTGVYFTEDEFKVEVIGKVTEEDQSETETYRANFFTWEQAVKEIDKIGRTDVTYEINLLDSLGYNEPPLKTWDMPAKAAKVIVKTKDGLEVKSIRTLATKISLKTDTDFQDIIINGSKQSGNIYYDIPINLECGKFVATLVDVQSYGTMKITGGATSEVTITPQNIGETSYTQISKVGKVTLHNPDGEDYSQFNMKDGIQGVKELILKQGVCINASKSEVSVTDLTIGEKPASESNDKFSQITAKNITVSGTTTMASASLRAGTTTVGDGKITLNNVIFEDSYNQLQGKQDKNGNSLINIKGTVDYHQSIVTNKDQPAATVSLYLNNSTVNYAKLTEGMTLLTAPKAAPSLFSPNYDYIENEGQNNEVTYSHMGPYVDTHGLYKSGNDIKYGYVDDMKVRVYVGMNMAEGSDDRVPVIEFRTFEEATKAIDAMSLYKQENPKELQDYCIELLKDVSIGNENDNGVYKNITLPSKANKVYLRGGGYRLYFTGNITLKCDMEFINITMTAMKTGNAVQPTTMNLAVGNYNATIHDNARFGYTNRQENGERNFVHSLNNITGSAKGSLIIRENVTLEANNITGLSLQYVGKGEDYKKDNEDNILTAFVGVTGNAALKKLVFSDHAAVEFYVQGKLTADAIYLNGENQVQIHTRDINPIQINGVVDENKKSDSVFVTGDGNNSKINLYVLSYYGLQIPMGTKVIGGKYLDPSDWNVTTQWKHDEAKYKLYLDGTNLCLGAKLEETE